jgi:uncharacterized protein (DUF1800 family)
VNGGYTQADVTQVARVLTGWTVDRPQRGGGFKFDENRHEPGTKKVLGKKIKEHGEQEGREAAAHAGHAPRHRQFISRKLAIRFRRRRSAASPRRSHGKVLSLQRRRHLRGPQNALPLARVLVHRRLSRQGQNAARIRRLRRARQQRDIDNMQPLVNALRDMGMPLYGAVPPTGYKWDASDWVSTGALVNRMNFALTLAANKLPGIAITWSAARIPRPHFSRR